MRWIPIGNGVVLHATGKKAAARALDACRTAELVVVNVQVGAREGCAIYDAKRLMKTGSLAVEPTSQGLKVTTARDVGGLRLWSQ